LRKPTVVGAIWDLHPAQGAGAHARSGVVRCGSVFQDAVGVRVGGDAVAPVQSEQLNQDRHTDNARAGAFYKFAAGFERASRGKEIIHDEDVLAEDERVGVDLEAVGAVFKVVGDAAGFARKLLGFADGDEAGGESLCNGGAEDESTRLGSDDDVHALAAIRVGHEFDGERKARRVGEERREVLKDDSGLGEVRDVADEFVERFGHGREGSVGVGRAEQ